VKYDKINEVKSYFTKVDDARIQNVKFKLIIVKDSYFFYIRKGYEKKFYEGGHMDIKGWYTGVLTFSKVDSDLLYVFISEIFYSHIKAVNIFLKILYQLMIFLDLDFFKFKHKKFRKYLFNYLKKTLPSEIAVDSNVVNTLLASQEDIDLFKDASIIIPHLSVHNLLERLPPSKDDVLYIEDVKSYLQPTEYMAEELKEHQKEHKHHHHHM
jgi:hypothetical protein